MIGVTAKLIPPDVDTVNNTIPGTSHFSQEVFPKDSLQQQDPSSVGFTFTKSEDPSVNRYGGWFEDNIIWLASFVWARYDRPQK